MRPASTSVREHRRAPTAVPAFSDLGAPVSGRRSTGDQHPEFIKWSDGLAGGKAICQKSICLWGMKGDSIVEEEHANEGVKFVDGKQGSSWDKASEKVSTLVDSESLQKVASGSQLNQGKTTDDDAKQGEADMLEESVTAHILQREREWEAMILERQGQLFEAREGGVLVLALLT
ncbi:hypothetical protein GUJ93_ZPchr0006g44106 [Zizania palustris]|uniref:Uncharacterized protein n=1 Tax=Zizania palustris TaxID=103762 RepID=A0A8J5W310_ZIZPA|nr:hypothetical protein GUJ93_ZPchr0006g44106 [Zizania palustris]